MEWIAILQTAIDYMEKHMMEEIDYSEIAERVHISCFHFHSAFSMIVGMTANEYLRKRRLSLAGQELTKTNAKVIDIAMRYGYDTPEGFTKAFTRFHGISPSDAKLPGTTLSLFCPMKLSISVEGGRSMDYRIEERKKFFILAKTRSFLNEKINEEGNDDIPRFWGECWSDGSFDTLKDSRINSANYAVCAPVSEKNDTFTYSIGILCNEDTMSPKGFDKVSVETGKFAVFTCIGKDGSSMEGVWEKIFNEFFPQSGYKMRFAPDFEYYPADGSDIFCEIWVPIE